MLATLTELGERKYSVRFWRNGRSSRSYILSQGMHAALLARGTKLWETRRFGLGRLGEQRQYEVRRKG